MTVQNKEETPETCRNGHPIVNTPVTVPDGDVLPSRDCAHWCNSRAQMRMLFGGSAK